jgi:hypothetical protein
MHFLEKNCFSLSHTHTHHNLGCFFMLSYHWRNDMFYCLLTGSKTSYGHDADNALVLYKVKLLIKLHIFVANESS